MSIRLLLYIHCLPRRSFLSLILLFSLDVLAQLPPTHKMDGTFLSEWLVLGPIETRTPSNDFLTSIGGEAKATGRLGEFVTLPGGNTLKWFHYKSNKNFIDLTSVFGDAQWSVAYAYCELDSDSDQEARFYYRSEPAFLFINGHEMELIANIDSPTHFPGIAKAALRKGKNALLLKLFNTNRNNTTGLHFQIQALSTDWADVTVNLLDPMLQVQDSSRFEVYSGNQLLGWNLSSRSLASTTLHAINHSYDIRLTSGDKGSWITNISLLKNQSNVFSATLTDAVSLVGQVLSDDGNTPQAGIPIQAFRSDFGTNPVETAISGIDGKFKFINLRHGRYRFQASSQYGVRYPIQHPLMDMSQSLQIPNPSNPVFDLRFVFPADIPYRKTSFAIGNELRPPSPTRLLIDQNQQVWVGTMEGKVYSFNGSLFRSIPELEHLFSWSISKMVELDSGNFLIGAGTKLVEWSPKTSRIVSSNTFPSSTLVSDVEVMQPDEYWVGTSKGLYHNKNGKLTLYTTKDGLPSDTIHSLAKSGINSLWIATSWGLCEYKNGQFSHDFALEHPWNSPVSRLEASSDDRLWFVLNNQIRFFKQGQVHQLEERDLMYPGPIHSLNESPDGTVCFGFADGFSFLKNGEVRNLPISDTTSTETIRDIQFMQDGTTWVATDRSVSKFDLQTFKSIGHPHGLKTQPSASVNVLSIEADPEGGHWLGTEWGGLFRLSHNLQLTPIKETSGQYIRTVKRARDGTIWFAGNKGLSSYKNGSVQNVIPSVWGIALELNPDDSTVWLGMGWNGGGLIQFDTSSGAKQVWDVSEGLPSSEVWSISKLPAGELLVGTSGGLASLKGDKLSLIYPQELARSADFSVYQIAAASNFLGIATTRGIYQINDPRAPAYHRTLSPYHPMVASSSTNLLIWNVAKLKDGTVWLASNRNGLIGFDGKTSTLLDRRDGLAGDVPFTLKETDDGALLIGFQDGGLTKYQPSAIPPKLVIKEIRLENQSFGLKDVLPPIETGRRISVLLETIDYVSAPNKLQFYYEISDLKGKILAAGVTKDQRLEWIPDQPGLVNLKIQSVNRDLKYSKPQSFSVRVATPWYEDRWILFPASGSIGALFFLAAFTGWKSRTNRKENEKLKELMLLQERDARTRLEATNKSLETAKEAAESANRAKSMFLTNMSHEFRTPLNVVLGYAQILRRDPKLTPDQSDAIITIERSGHHLLTLINEVLDLAKIESGHTELIETEFALDKFLEEILSLFELKCRQKRLTWKIQANELNGKSARTDVGKLRQVLINLLGNAVKFTDSGSVVLTVTIDKIPSTSSLSSVRFEVVDTGPGMDAETQHNLFTPFSQGKEGLEKGGTGLGLAIARRQVEILGGCLVSCNTYNFG